MRLTAFLAIASAIALTQSPDPSPKFESITIHPADPQAASDVAIRTAGLWPGMSGGPGSRDPRYFTCQNVSMQGLIAVAFDLPMDRSLRRRISGPAWLNAATFDIAATLPADARMPEFRRMLQTLLADRFHFVSHYETKNLWGWELQLGKRYPKKLKESAILRGAPEDTGMTSLQFFTESGYPHDHRGFPVIPEGGPTVVTIRQDNGACHTTARGASMNRLIDLIRVAAQVIPDAFVADATGLTGRYDFELTYFREMERVLRPSPREPREEGPQVKSSRMTPIDSTLPGILDAIQTLGLRLEQKDVPVDILVVDQISQPSNR